MTLKPVASTFVGMVFGVCLAGLAQSTWKDQSAAESVNTTGHSDRPLETATSAAAPRPSLESVLAASSEAVLIDLLGRFLHEATSNDLETIANHWGMAFDFSSYLEEAKWKLLLLRWIAIDPAGAIACVENLHGREEWRLRKLRDFCFAAWAKRDLPAALAKAMTSPNESLSGLMETVIEQDIDRALSLLERFPKAPGVAAKVLAKLAESDPVKALAMAKELPSSVRESALRAVLAAQAESNPKAALAETLKLDSLRTRSEVAIDLIQKIAENDPNKAESLVNQLPPGEVRQKAFESLTWSLARRDPVAALAWAKGLPSGPERQSAIARTLREVANRDPNVDVLAMLDDLGWENVLPNPTSLSSDGNAGSLAYKAIANLAKTDPRAALGYLARLPNKIQSKDDLRSRAAARLIDTWFGQNPNEALSALESLPNADVRKEAARKLAGSNASEETIRKLADSISQIKDEPILQTLAPMLAQRLARASPNETVEWIDALPAEVQAEAMNRAVATFMKEDPALAQEQILQMEMGDYRKASVTRMLETLAEQDVASAIAWYNSLGTEDQHAEGVGAVAGWWFSKDPAEAAAWAAGLPPDLHDEATWNFVNHSFSTADYAQASQWAETMLDDARRESVLSMTFENWLSRDHAAAEPALYNSTLTEETKRRLLEQ